HHHDHDHEHEHHHEYDENGVCSCGHHHHDHDHHHHHADEVFDSIGIETNTHYTKEKLEEILKSLDDEERFGNVLRAKGMLPTDGDRFLHFDYVPEEFEVREGASEVTGKICVIGAGIKEEEVKKLFS
ncbi:MAG TPA: cobalamin biosynthesis protein CobW, partial [Lachnospiraceae bacterium]|nr:cobalamin biosynthesis protein CobW [Lachnospiraceae bacterium]